MKNMSDVSYSVNSIVNEEYHGVEQKNSYLALFAENEKLREQLSEIRRTTLINEKAIRAAAVKSLMTVILRSRMSLKQRYYYDIWLNNCRIMKLQSAINHHAIKLEVGLQRIESERNYLKKTEALNSKLKLTLVMSLFFYKWKSKAAKATLTEERRLYEYQRKLILEELVHIRKTVLNANKQEVSVLSNALIRGDELCSALDNLKSKLHNAVELCNLP